MCEAYIQTVLAAIAIDKMAARMLTSEGFNVDLFSSMNNDSALMQEIQVTKDKTAADLLA